MGRTHKLGILFSGGGTTMAAIGRAIAIQQIPDIKLVAAIASRADAIGIEKAKRFLPGKDILVIDPHDFRLADGKIDRIQFGEALLHALRERQVTVVTQNGWLPMTPLNVIEEYQGCIFNQHPGPVPEFGGRGMIGETVHLAVINFYRLVKRPGWTQLIGQYVHEQYDEGAVVASTYLDILPTDTPESLQRRALPIVHSVQIKLLQDFVSGGLTTEKERRQIVYPGEEKYLELAKKMALRGELYEE